jgi:hypothetical protein
MVVHTKEKKDWKYVQKLEEKKKNKANRYINNIE